MIFCDQKNVRDTLQLYDLMVVLGADVLRMSVWSEVDPMPVGLPILQIGLVDWEMGKNYPAEQAVYGDLRETLTAIVPVLREKGGDDLVARAAANLEGLKLRNWSAKRSQVVDAIEAEPQSNPMSPDMFCLRVIDALPDDAVVVHEGLTSTRYLPDLLAYKDRYSYHGFASGGIGWAVPAAVGVQLAQPDRPVCAVIGDGSSMYSIQALWTAAHLKLPMTYVIADNGAYRILKQRLKAFYQNDHFVGMDLNDPPIDFVGLAKSLGIDSVRVSKADDLRDAVAEGMASGKPNLVDAMIDGSV